VYHDFHWLAVHSRYILRSRTFYLRLRNLGLKWFMACLIWCVSCLARKTLKSVVVPRRCVDLSEKQKSEDQDSRRWPSGGMQPVRNLQPCFLQQERIVVATSGVGAQGAGVAFTPPKILICWKSGQNTWKFGHICFDTLKWGWMTIY